MFDHTPASSEGRLTHSWASCFYSKIGTVDRGLDTIMAESVPVAASRCNRGICNSVGPMTGITKATAALPSHCHSLDRQ